MLHSLGENPKVVTNSNNKVRKLRKSKYEGNPFFFPSVFSAIPSVQREMLHLRTAVQHIALNFLTIKGNNSPWCCSKIKNNPVFVTLCHPSWAQNLSELCVIYLVPSCHQHISESWGGWNLLKVFRRRGRNTTQTITLRMPKSWPMHQAEVLLHCIKLDKCFSFLCCCFDASFK